MPEKKTLDQLQLEKERAELRLAQEQRRLTVWKTASSIMRKANGRNAPMSFATSAVQWRALPRCSKGCPSRKCMSCWKPSFLCRRCSTCSVALPAKRRTQNMALFHFTADQIKRSEGDSVIASAAYRSGEKLHSTYYGEDSDYTRKKGVICSEILLPPHAPREFADRETLWNAVEHAEHGKKAQLAYSFEISLQNEFSLEENIALARKFFIGQLCELWYDG